MILSRYIAETFSLVEVGNYLIMVNSTYSLIAYGVELTIYIKKINYYHYFCYLEMLSANLEFDFVIF